MRNNIKHTLIIAIVAAIIMAFSGCANDFFDDDGEQTTVTITGIPNTYHGKYAWGGLTDPSQNNNKKNTNTAIALHTKIGDTGRVTLDMYQSDYSPASVNNKSAFVILLINESSKETTGNMVEKYVLKVVTPGSNTFDWEDFNDIE